MLLSTVDIQNSIQPDVAPGFAFKLLPWKPRAIFSGVYLSDFVKKKCPKQNTHLTHLTHHSESLRLDEPSQSFGFF